MGGRVRHNWALFVGGPFDGQRRILQLNIEPGPPFRIWTRSDVPGMVTPHEYELTETLAPKAFHESPARIARFVRTLANERARTQVAS
ncbi:MAG: hypothetical protein SFZ23_03605 [Planctomycetota bacterium]|nr:hypothetical protein [Planctomycetota bacterium]